MTSARAAHRCRPVRSHASRITSARTCGAKCRRSAAPGPVLEAREALLEEPLTPPGDDLAPATQTVRDLAIVGLVVGLGGALLGQAIGDLGGSLAEITLIGALTVTAAGAVTLGFGQLLGAAGTAVAVLLFVVAGNSSAGGGVPTPLLPFPWREISPLLPNGAATTLVRNAAYFPNASLTTALLTLTAWLIAGLGLALLLAQSARAIPRADPELAGAAIAA